MSVQFSENFVVLCNNKYSNFIIKIHIALTSRLHVSLVGHVAVHLGAAVGTGGDCFEKCSVLFS